MKKLEKTRNFLMSIGMPKFQQADLCCYSLLAMANIKETSEWKDASNEWVRIHDILQFTKEYYGVAYAENSRETFRKQEMYHFRNTSLIEDNGKLTNSPNYRYRITSKTLDLMYSFKSTNWGKKLENFKENHKSLIELYESKKKMIKMPVKINDSNFTFSAGVHNLIQKLIIEKFAPHFAPISKCLYIGDTIKRFS